MKKVLGIISILVVTQSMATPQGFKVISSDGGVTIYKKHSRGEQPDYIQEIDLTKGAKIELRMGRIVEERKTWGKHKGRNPKIKRQSLKVVWTEAKKNNQNTVCVTNGQFFGTRGYPTTLAFPLKINGIEYDGYEEVYDSKHIALDIKSDRVEMNQFSYDDMPYLSKNAIVGLSTTVDMGRKTFKGRTFIGIADKNEDGISETILIYNSKMASQKSAKDILNAFGATDMMMLDGGGSSQLICNGKSYVSSSRTIPQSIATIKGDNKVSTYEQKVNFVFENLEKRYSFYFPKGSSTKKNGSNFYRRYRVQGKYHYLYAYNKIMYYNIGSGWKKFYSVNDWYNYFKR